MIRSLATPSLRGRRSGVVARFWRAMRSFRISGVLTLAFVSLGHSGVAWGTEGSSPVTGRYVSTEDGYSTLAISAQEDGLYAIELSGGGGSATGPAAAADCYIRAVGVLEGTTLTAKFTAVENETFSYSDWEAEDEGRTVVIRAGSDTVEVLSADTFGYCGVEASFDGPYERSQD